MNSPLLNQMIQRLSRLPGLGPRSGRRLALFLLKHRERLLKPLLHALSEGCDKIHPCPTCGYLDELSPCRLCTDTKRNKEVLCVVSEATDVWAIERLRRFKGVYHILGGNLSMLDGVGPKDLRVASLLERLQTTPPKELILAMSPTVEGTTTAHFVMQEIQKVPISFKITTLARGVPMGGELDFLDNGTLELALLDRKPF